MGALRTRKNTNLKVRTTIAVHNLCSSITPTSLFQVILGLLFPPFIKKLDFKSKEELQSMPQTEEEHLENRNLDYEEEKKLPDAEVSHQKRLPT
jgi:transient receptor potential cation channel subfamily M member 3